MRAVYIKLPEQVLREAARRAAPERRSTREQIGYDLERLYRPDAVELRESAPATATSERAS